MHQIILLTAMTATSGLFGGGGRHCGTGHCGRQVHQQCYAAPVYYQHQYYAQPCAPCAVQAHTYAAPQAAPAPLPAPQAPAKAPQAATAPQAYYPYQQAGAYYYYPAAPSCATGNCPNR